MNDQAPTRIQHPVHASTLRHLRAHLGPAAPLAALEEPDSA
ncbi:hypothetical protein [Planosporangium thailandense]|nr:hypothetical protein [Planosporangium thailandense]